MKISTLKLLHLPIYHYIIIIVSFPPPPSPSDPLRRVAVPDSRYDWLCEHWKPPSCIPAYLHVVDIAGLVQGAHEGKVNEGGVVWHACM